MILTQKTIDSITTLATASPLARRNWRDRGRAPLGYTKGMAAAFGQAYVDLKADDPAVKAMVAIVNGQHDIFDHCEDQFNAAGMPNIGEPDADRLRHLFVFLTGLGMRESSGRYCEGRDRSASNTSAETAEAGMFQQSWDSRTANPEIEMLFDGPIQPTYLDIFKEGVTPRTGDLDNYGSGDGQAFQAACKKNPRFATQVAAIGLRTLYTHWGPAIRREVELAPEADALFKQVQAIIDQATPAKSWFSTIMDAVLSMFRKVAPIPSVGPPWMPVAIKEIGFHEVGVNLGTDKYIAGSKDGGRVGEYWCADFVNYCLETSGIRGTRSAMARSFERDPNFVKLDGPTYGAITTMWRNSPDSGQGHVFFYLGHIDANNVLGLGGNQSDSVDKEPHPTSRIIGYYWPKGYALPKIGKIAVNDSTAEGSET